MLIGPGSILARNFVVGYVTVCAGGSIPLHDHDQEEAYVLLQGQALLTAGDEETRVEAVTAVYIPPGEPHGLRNIGAVDVVLVFVYSPGGLVSHWQEEREGRLREGRLTGAPR